MMTEQLTQALSIPDNPIHASAETASFSSNSVDMSKFQRCMALIDIGAVSGTSPTFDAIWQSSPDNSTFTNVSGFNNLSITTITTGNQTKTMEIESAQVPTGNRYVRVAVTLGGTSPSFTCTVLLIGGNANQKPASANDSNQVTERKVAS